MVRIENGKRGSRQQVIANLLGRPAVFKNHGERSVRGCPVRRRRRGLRLRMGRRRPRVGPGRVSRGLLWLAWIGLGFFVGAVGRVGIRLLRGCVVLIGLRIVIVGIIEIVGRIEVVGKVRISPSPPRPAGIAAPAIQPIKSEAIMAAISAATISSAMVPPAAIPAVRGVASHRICVRLAGACVRLTAADVRLPQTGRPRTVKARSRSDGPQSAINIRGGIGDRAGRAGYSAWSVSGAYPLNPL